MNTVPVAVGGIFAALVGAVASIHWDKGTIADFRMDVNKQIADLRMGMNKQIEDLRTDVNKEFGRLWAANEKLLSSHGKLRNNMQAIKETLKKTQNAQEDCATLQAARLEILQ